MMDVLDMIVGHYGLNQNKLLTVEWNSSKLISMEKVDEVSLLRLDIGNHGQNRKTN